MATSGFDCLVLGDEPTGLWLISKLHRIFAKDGVRSRLGWIQLSPTAPRLPVPTWADAVYGLGLGKPWSLSLVTPKRAFQWTEKELIHEFPRLSRYFKEYPAHAATTASSLRAIEGLLREYPELLGFAQGIWKFLGRTHHLDAVSLVSAALRLTHLAWWDAESLVPTAVERISVGQSAFERLTFPKSGWIELKFPNLDPILTCRLVITCRFSQLEQLSRDGVSLRRILGLHENIRPTRALYPLHLQVASKVIPAPVPPVTLYFDTECIPDPNTEVWPVEYDPVEGGRERLTLWPTGPGFTSLDSVLDVFREALGRAHRLFPFLPQSVTATSAPLSMEQCFSSAYRSTVLSELESSRHEIYSSTLFEYESLKKGIWFLSPFVHAHLPYPLGTLKAGQQLVLDVVSAHLARNRRSDYDLPKDGFSM